MSDTQNTPAKSQKREGQDRRSHRGRNKAVALIVLNCVAALTAITALVFVVADLTGRIDTIQEARQKSAFDTCRILDVLIDASGNTSQRSVVYNGRGQVIGYVQFGGSDQKAKVQSFISQAGLSNCHEYAVRVRNGTLRPPPARP